MGPTLSQLQGNYSTCPTRLASLFLTGDLQPMGGCPVQSPPPVADGEDRGNASRGAGPARPPPAPRAASSRPRRRLRAGAGWRPGQWPRSGPPQRAPLRPSPLPLSAPPEAGPGGDQSGDVKGERGGCRRAPAPAQPSPARRPPLAPRGPTPAFRAEAPVPARACAGSCAPPPPAGTRTGRAPGAGDPQIAQESPTGPRQRCRTS
jgi:hypothetical protein